MREALILLMMLLPVAANAQGDVEYRMEVGAGLGLVAYEGDFNGNVLKNQQPMASVLLRRIINPYHGFRLAASIGTLKGSSKDDKSYYPGLEETAYTFKNTMADLCATYEYNFWPYGTGHDYRGARRITPFIFLGLGATYADTAEGSKFTGNFPIGAGVKFKIATRLNLGVEWAMHFTWSDELDGVADPYGIKSSGLFKNTDGYSALQVSLTYSFLPKCKTCNKDRDY